MLHPIENKVLVKVTSKYIQAVSDILRLSALQNNTSIDPADFVTIRGEVVMLPKKISEENKGWSMDNIKVGDLAIFSYQVIYDIIYKIETDTFEYVNMVKYKGVEYFLVDIKHVFAVVRDERVVMQNGWVMATEYPQSLIITKNANKKEKGTVSSVVMHKTKGFNTGEEILYSPFKPQHYQINDKPFIILKRSHILGKI